MLGKGILSFSLLFYITYFKAQTIIRFSDGKTVESIVIKNDKKNEFLTSSNLKNFQFKEGTQILYNNKVVDFAMNNDTLVVFDKVKELEEVEILNFNNKTEKTVKKTNQQNFFYALNSNYQMGTSVQINTEDKVTYVKSISVFPVMKNKEVLESGKMKIEILPNINGDPDEKNPILSFDEDVKRIKTGTWLITFPRIIKYPKNGFFIVFHFQYNKNNVFALSFKTTKESNVYYYNPTYYGGWKKDESQGILYKLKILQ